MTETSGSSSAGAGGALSPGPGWTVVHLVRHGEVDNPAGVLYGRLPGFHLSEDGPADGQGRGRVPGRAGTW